ncbi:MAG: hypothetical protein JF615_04535 [Asticcacaulis sp.]|nr:hypothetical protein [Asticcacaulis sp.]
MKVRLAVGIAFLALSGTVAHAGEVTDLNWLSGCWVETKGDRTVEEQWLKPSGGVMLGTGRTVRAGALRDYEFTRIAAIDGVLTYFAQPFEQAPASFAAISQAPDRIVFENKDHDFPQRVIYQRTGVATLHAAIEGTMNGQTKTITWDYQRCE